MLFLDVMRTFLFRCFDRTALLALHLITVHDFIIVRELNDIFIAVYVSDVKCFLVNADHIDFLCAFLLESVPYLFSSLIA